MRARVGSKFDQPTTNPPTTHPATHLAPQYSSSNLVWCPHLNLNSSVVSLAQLVSLSVELPAQLVLSYLHDEGHINS